MIGTKIIKTNVENGMITILLLKKCVVHAHLKNNNFFGKFILNATIFLTDMILMETTVPITIIL